MKYIRTYGDYNSWKTDYSDTSRGFRLKPTLYKYSDVGVESNILLEIDDPRKHGDSTYMEITLDSDAEFSFYIGNAPDDTQTTMTCSIDWGDGTVETKTITKDDKGFKLSHNYTAGSYKIELYGVERDYSVVGDVENYESLISPIESVKRVVLGNSVVSIGDEAFYNCSNLTSIHIPESVTSIGESAFCSCISLVSIHIPESVTSIGESAFDGCESLTSVYISEGVTNIGYTAFRGCSSLTSINIPEGVTSIGNNAFEGCSSLTSIHIPESVTSIGNNAFGDCYSLTSAVLPNNATIHPDTFKGAGMVTIDSVSYGVGTSELTVGNYTFNDTSFLTFYLNGNPYSYVDSIDSVVVSDCDMSRSGDLIIPSTISYSGVTYNVTSIVSYAFRGCSSLTSIHIPESVVSIGEYVFEYCSSLTSIHIPESVVSIGWGVFTYCSKLTSIYSYNTTAPSLNTSAFSNMSTNGTLHIKPGATGYDAWLSKLPSGWTIVEDL